MTSVALVTPWAAGPASAAERDGRSRGAAGGALATLEIDAAGVEVNPAGKGGWSTGKDGQGLKAGDAVRTDATGQAEIAYADGSLTRLDVDTEYKLVKLSSKKGDRKTKGLQSAGQTWHRVEKLADDDSYKVEGANATAAVLGTAFVVTCVSRNQCTFTAVVDPIRLTDPGPRNGTKTVTLTPGDQAIVVDDAIGPVETLTQEELLAIDWIVENLLADQEAGKSTGTDEVAGQPDPPPTRPTSSPIVDPPPPPPAGTGTGTGAGTGTGTGTGTAEQPANQGPTAADDAYTMPEDTLLVEAAATGVLANDTDPDGDPLQMFLTSLPTNGAVVNFPDGAFVYVPDDDFHGTDSFTYVAGDGEFGSNPATVTITVTPQNDAPVAQDDAYEVDEDGLLQVPAAGVLANDGDVDSSSLTAAGDFETADYPENGSLTLNPDGSFTYEPHENFAGTDSFTYQASDGVLLSNVATVTITVNPVNDAPDAVADNYTVDEDGSLVVPAPGVLDNDSDADDDPLTVVWPPAEGITLPEHGTLTPGVDGGFTYTPDDDFAGNDFFVYGINDGTSTSTATVSITVNPINDAPVANDDTYTADIDTPLVVDVENGVLDNDTDADADELTVELFEEIGSLGAPVEGTPTEHGTVTLAPDGSFVYTPDESFTGTDSFQYIAMDATSDSAPATVTITVEALVLPTAVPKVHEIDPGESFAFTLEAYTIDGFTLTPAGAVVDTTPESGSLWLADTPVADGDDVGTAELRYEAPEEPGVYWFTWHAYNEDGDSVIATEYFVVGELPILDDIFFYAPPGETSTGTLTIYYPPGLPDATCASNTPASGFGFAGFVFGEASEIIGFTVSYTTPEGTEPTVLTFMVNACFGDGFTVIDLGEGNYEVVDSGAPEASLGQDTTVYVGVGYGVGAGEGGEDLFVDPPVAAFTDPVADDETGDTATASGTQGEDVYFTITAIDPNDLPIDISLDEYTGPGGSLELVSHSGDEWTFVWQPDPCSAASNELSLKVRNLAGQDVFLTLTIDYEPAGGCEAE